jgi:uncharacterized integral membrane protein
VKLEVLSVNRIRERALPLIVFALVGALAGCVTADKYRLAEAGGSPAKALDLGTGTAPLGLTLTNVIVTGGPGSWKLKALWDEYVVLLVNRGDAAITVQSAQLIDTRAQAYEPYPSPWELEALGYTSWDRSGRSTLRAAGWTVEGVALALTAAIAGSSGRKPGPPSALGKVAIAAGAVGLVDLIVVAVLDSRNESKVEEEFQRRRLRLPLLIAPQESVKGSLFFPVTPEPRRLILNGVSGAQALEVTLDLVPLAGLQRKSDR